jgi:hypothetical protein
MLGGRSETTPASQPCSTLGETEPAVSDLLTRHIPTPLERESRQSRLYHFPSLSCRIEEEQVCLGFTYRLLSGKESLSLLARFCIQHKGQHAFIYQQPSTASIPALAPGLPPDRPFFRSGLPLSAAPPFPVSDIRLTNEQGHWRQYRRFAYADDPKLFRPPSI